MDTIGSASVFFKGYKRKQITNKAETHIIGGYFMKTYEEIKKEISKVHEELSQNEKVKKRRN